MSLGDLNTELVAAAARSVRRPPQRPSYCPWASDAAILGVTVSNDCYLRILLKKFAVDWWEGRAVICCLVWIRERRR